MTTELFANRSLDSRKDAFIKEIKGIVNDADELIKEMADSTSDEFTVARAEIAARMSDARARLTDALGVVSDKARGAADATQDYVLANPWKVLGLAAAGLLVGVLMSRR